MGAVLRHQKALAALNADIKRSLARVFDISVRAPHRKKAVAHQRKIKFVFRLQHRALAVNQLRVLKFNAVSRQRFILAVHRHLRIEQIVKRGPVRLIPHRVAVRNVLRYLVQLLLIGYHTGNAVIK